MEDFHNNATQNSANLQSGSLENDPVHWRLVNPNQNKKIAQPKSNYSLKWAFVIGFSTITLFILLFITGWIIIQLNHPKSNTANQVNTPTNSYPALTIPLDNLAKTGQLQIGQADQLVINGQLKLNNEVVLTPTGTPKSATPGEFYFDSVTNQPYFYNGSQYVNIDSGAVVTSIGGLSGVVSLGAGLQVNGGTLSVSQGNTGVTSLQGQTGNVQFTSGTGIGLNGTTISNTGVTSLGGSTGAVNVGTGLAVTNNTIATTTNITSGSANITVTPDGQGNFTISEVGVGAGGTIALGPAAPQVDPSTNPSVWINKTGNGNFLDFQFNGTDQFIVNQAGQITKGTIPYSQVTGTPAFVSSIAGQSGAITLGLGLSNIGNQIINAGVDTLTGTANQITVSSNTGNVTLSLPQNIATTSSPTFNGLTLNSPLAVGSGGTGATSGAGARTNLGAAASGANSDITSLTGLTVINPPAGLTIGNNGQTLTLQGSNTIISDTSAGNTSTLSFAAPSTNATITIPNATGTVCLTTGNCLGGGTGGANTALSNLAGVSINTSLLTGNNNINLGSTSNPFNNLFLGGTATNNFEITGTATGTRVITLPDATGTLCLTTGNCAGAGSGITGNGTSNTVALFSGSQNIGNSIITQNAGATIVTVGGALVVNNGITGNGSLITNLNGANIQNATVANAALANSSITINNGTNETGGGLVSLGGSITLGTVNNPTFSTSVTTPTLNSSAALSVSSGGAHTVTIDTGGAAGITIGGTNANALTLGNASVQASLPGGLTTNGSAITTAGGNLTLGAGNLTNSGTINGQTISSSANFTGTVNIQGNNSLTLGTASSKTGSIIFEGSTTNGNITLVGPNNPSTNDYTLSIPVLGSNATLCTTDVVCAGYAPSSGSSSYVQLQGSTPGSAQTGNTNITGTAIAGSFSGSGTNLTTLNATQLTSGTVNDLRLSANVTLQGNTFNGASELLQLNPSGNLPAVGGDNITTLNGSSINAGTVADTYLSANVTLQGNTFNGASQLVQTAVNGYLPGLNGSNLTNLNATQLTSGTVNDLRLSSNVPLLNANNTFSGSNTFSSALTVNTIQPTAAMTIGATSQALTLQGNASTVLTSTASGKTTTIGFTGTPVANVTYNFDTAAPLGTYTICTSIGNCAGSGSGATTSTGTTNTLPKYTGANSIGNSNLSDNGTTLTVTDAGLFQAGSNSTTAFQIQNAAGTDNLFVADTSNDRIAIDQGTANFPLDVNGDINSTTALRVGGNVVCTASGCSSSGSSGFYIQNGTTTQTGANFNIQSVLNSDIGGVIKGATGQTADLLQGQNSGGSPVAEIKANGDINTVGQYQINGSQIASSNLSDNANLAKLNGTGPQTFTGNNKFTGTFLVQPASDSTTELQIQNTAGTDNLFTADTTDSRIGIDTATPGYALDVNGDINISTGHRFLINGVAICGVAPTCAPSAGSNFYIQNGTTTQTNSNFNIQSASPTSVVGEIQGASGQSADLLDVLTGAGSPIFDVTSAGHVAIGAAVPSYQLDVQGAGTVNAQTGLYVGGNLVCTSSGCTGVGGGSFVNLQGTTPGTAQSGNLNITGTAIAGFFNGDGSLLTNLNGANIQAGSVANAALANSSITINNGTNITGGNTVSLGGSLTVGTVNNPTFATSVTTPLLTSTGTLNVTAGTNLVIASTGAQTVSIDTGGAAGITIGGTNASALTLGRTGVVASLPGGLTTNGANIATAGGNVNLGAGNLTNTGTINSQTISSTANFTGTVTIQGSNSLTLGAAGVNTGSIVFNGSATSGNITLIGPANPSTNNYTLSIPVLASNSTICTTDQVCTGYAPTSGSGNYVNLQATTPGSQQVGNFNINGTGIVGSLTTNTENIGFGSSVGQLYVGGNIPGSAAGSVTTGATSVPNSVYVQGRYAYVVSGTTNTLKVFDVSNPGIMANIGSVSTGAGTNPMSIYVQGHYAFVADNGNNTLQVFDLSNPSSPTSVATVTTGSSPRSIFVSGRYAYVANFGSNNMQIFDVSNPASPISDSTIGSLNGPYSVFVQDRYAYVASYNGNALYVIDINNPFSPSNSGSVSTGASSNPSSVFVQGRYAFVTEYTANILQIIDVGNPASPSLKGSVSTNSHPDSVYVQDKFAYVTDFTGSDIGVFEMQQPNIPLSIGTVTGLASPSDIMVSGRWGYVTNSQGSLAMYDFGGTYTQQLEAGGAEVGTLQVATNEQVFGNSNIQGSLAVGGTLDANGNVAVLGSTYLTGAVSVAGGVLGGYVTNSLSAPASPTISFIGTTGTNTTYTYTIVAVAPGGGLTTASAGGTINSGDTVFGSMNSSNYNLITWNAVSGASSYQIYRTVGGTTQGLIGTTTLTNFSDTGLAGNGATAPTNNTSGSSVVNGNLNVNGYATFTPTVNSTNSFQIQNAAGANLFNVDTTNTKITVSQGDFVVVGLGAPSSLTPSVGSNQGGTFSGAPGTTYYYEISAINNVGETLVGSETTFSSNSFTPLSAPSSGPSAAAAAGAGLSSGVYKYEVTFVTANGETTGSPETSVTTSSGNDQVSLTSIPTGPTGTTARSIYRTSVGGASGSEKFVATIADNSTTTYTDSTADAALTAVVPTINTATTNTNNIVLTFSSVPGATSYKIYRGTSSGGENFYNTTASSPYTDTGGGTGGNPQGSDATDRVGIGTSTPTANLQILGTTIFQTPTNTINAFQFQNAAGTNILGISTTPATVTNSALGSWSTNSSGVYNGSGGVWDGQSFSYNGYLYYLGGCWNSNGGGGGGGGNCSSTWVNTVINYFKLNSNGSTGPTLTEATALGGSFSPNVGSQFTFYNGYLYQIGGTCNTCGLSNVVNYIKVNSDGTMGTVNTTTTLPLSTDFSVGGAYNGYLYVVRNATTTVYYAPINSNGTLGSWSTTSSTPGALSYSTSVIANGYIYLFGGQGTNVVYISKIQSNGSLGAWSSSGSTLPVNIYGAQAQVYNNTVYLMGGTTTGSNQFNTIYSASLNPSTGAVGSWSNITGSNPIPQATAWGASAVGTNGYLYYLTGYTGSNFTGNTSVYYNALPGPITTAQGSMTINAAINAVGPDTYSDLIDSVNAYQFQTAAGNDVLNVNTLVPQVNTEILSAPSSVTASLAPVAPAVTNTCGSSCTATYNYEVVGIDANGGQTVPSPASTNATSAPTVLNGLTNKETLNITATTNIVTYLVYRTLATSATGNSATLGLIGSTTSTGAGAFIDSGQPATNPAPAAGTLTNTQAYFFKVTSVDSNGGESAPSSEVSTAATTATNLAITLSWASISGARSYHVYYGTSAGGEANYFTVYSNNYTFSNSSPTGNVAAVPPGSSTAFNDTLASTGSSQITLGNTSGSQSFGQLDVAGSIPFNYVGAGTTYGSSGTALGMTVQGSNAFISSINQVSAYDVSVPSNPTFIGQSGTSNNPHAFAANGKYVYVAQCCGAFVMQVFDVSNPASPVAVGSVSININSPTAMYAAGHYVYVAHSTGGGVEVIDVSNPAAPVIVNTINIPNAGITVSGRFMYLNVSSINLVYVYDISNPLSPVQMTTISVTTPVSATASGNYLYVNGAAGTSIYNISNASNPYLVSRTAIMSGTSTISGHYAYIISSPNIQVWDISNPYSPLKVGTISTPGTPSSLFIYGRYLYVLESASNTFLIYDLGGAYVQNLQTGITETGQLQVDNGAQINGDSAFSGNLSANGNVEINGTLSVGNAAIFENQTNSTNAYQFQNAAGTNVMNIDTTNTTVDLNTIAAPTTLTAMLAPTAVSVTPQGTIGAVTYTYYITAVSSKGSETLAASGTTNIGVTPLTTVNFNQITWTAPASAPAYYKIYKQTGPGTPGYIGSSTSTSFNDQMAGGAAVSNLNIPALSTAGSLSTGTNYFYEITSVDAAGNESLPSSQLTTATSATYKSIALSWNVVPGAKSYKVYRSLISGSYSTDTYYTVTSNSFNDTGAAGTGTNTAPPTIASAYASNLNNGANATITLGSNGTSTAQLYMGGNLQSTVLSSTAITGGLAGEYSVQGRYVYVMNSTTGNLEIYDVFNPRNPILIYNTFLGSPSGNSAIEGNYLYVGINGAIDVMDISNPGAPVQVGTVGTFTALGSLAVSGRYMYASFNASNLVQIYDVSGVNPRLVYTIPITGPGAVIVQGEFAYINSTSGMQIWNISNTSNPSLLSTTAGFTADAVQNNIIYGATSSALAVFDANNAKIPVQIATLSTSPNAPNSMYISGRYLYYEVGGTSNTINVADISNPSEPTNISSISGASTGPITVQGRYLYLGTTSNLIIYDTGGAYIQGLQAGNLEASQSYVDGNSTVGQDLVVGGVFQLSGSAQIGGNIDSAGSAYIAGSEQINGATEIGTGIYGGFTETGLTSPTPAVAFVGTQGTAATWCYQIVSVAASGLTAATSSSGCILSFDNTTLSATASNKITWIAQTGAASYKIYRVNVGTSPATTGLIATVTGTSYLDIGVAGDSSTAPALDSSSTFTIKSTNASTTPTTILQVQNALGTTILNISGAGAGSATNSVSANGLLGPTGVIATLPPVAPTSAVFAGTAGVAKYGYEVVAVDVDGGTTIASPQTTMAAANGNATLGGSNNVTLTYTAVAGATNYLIYRTLATSATGNSATLGLIGSSTGTSFVDNGYPATATVPSNTGTLAATTYFIEVTAIDDMGGESTPSTQISKVVGSANLVLDISWNPVSGARKYRVYISTTSGVYTTDTFFTVTTNTFNYGISGAIGGSNLAPPTSSTAYNNILSNSGNSQITLGASLNSGTASAAQIDVSGYTTTIPLGSITAPGAHNVVVQGNYAYLNGTASFQIYDVSNPSNPQLISTLAAVGSVNDSAPLQVQGKYAYIPNGSGFYIVDISNPVSPTLVASPSILGTQQGGFYVQGKYAYMGSNTALNIFDISNPALPLFINSIALSAAPAQLMVQGRYAYVSNASGLQIVDISNPLSLSIISTFASANITNIFVQNNYVYATNGTTTFTTINVSNPYAPTFGGSLALGTQLSSVYVAGRFAYVSDYSGQAFYAIDVSNPNSPLNYSGFQNYSVPTSGGGYYADDIFVSGRYAYITTNFTNAALSISDLGGAYTQNLQAGTTQTGTLQVDGNTNINGTTALMGGLTVGQSENVNGTLAVTGTTTFSGSILNSGGFLGGFTENAALSTPSAPTVTFNGTVGTTATWTYKIVAVGAGGGVTAASAAGSISASDNSVISGGNFNIVSWSPVSGAVSYKVYRTAVGTNPVTTGLISTTSNTFINDTGLAGDNSTPPVINTSNTLGSIAIGNGNQTSQLFVGGFVPAANLGSVSTLSPPGASFISGNYYYVILNSGTLNIYSVPNNGAPGFISSLASAGNGSIYVQGNYAYITSANTLKIIDVSNPNSASIIKTFALSGTPNGIYVSGRYAYVVLGDNLQIIDVSNATNPAIVSTFATFTSSGATNSNPTAISVQGRYAFVVNSAGANPNLQAIDISNPFSPVSVSNVTLSINASSITIAGNYAYITTSSGFMQIVLITNPTGMSVVSTTALSSAAGAPLIQGRYAYLYEANGTLQEFDISNPASVQLAGSFSFGADISVGAILGRNLILGNTSDSIATYDIGGSYIQQLQAGGTETGTLQVDANSNINGNETIGGGFEVYGNTQVGGNIGSAGNLYIAGATQLNGALEVGAGIYGGYTETGLTVPGAPTVTFGGTTGTSATWSYKIVAVAASGQTTAASAVGSILASDNTTLSNTAYNILSWTAVTGATQYKIYRTAVGTSPNTTGLIGTTVGTKFVDNGVAGDSSTAPATDSTNTFTVSSSVNTQNAFNVQTSGGTILLNVNTSLGTVGLGQLTPIALINVSLAPTAPVITPTGSGSAFYFYEVVGVDARGSATVPSASAGTTNASSLNCTTNSNSLNITSSGATRYYVYRSSTSLATGNSATTGLIGSTTSTGAGAFTDCGQLATSVTPGSGSLANGTTYYFIVHVIDSTGGESQYTFENSATATNATNNAIALSWAPATGARGYRVYYGTSPGGEANYVTVYSNTYLFTSNPPTGSTAGAPGITNTAYSTSFSGSGNSQITLGNTSNIGSSAQLDVAGSIPATYTGQISAANASNMFVLGSFEYVIYNGVGTFSIFNISNPANPILLSTTGSVVASPNGIYVQGNYAYISGGSFMYVFDVTNPSKPVELSVTEANTNGNGVSGINVQGNYAYLYTGGGFGGVAIFNISNPSSPLRVSSINLGALVVANGFVVQGNILYVLFSGGLTSYNIANPLSPTLYGTVTVSNTTSFYIQGNYAYIVSSTGNLLSIIDISNPLTPYVTGTLSTGAGSAPNSIYVQSHYAYITNSTSGTLQVVDVSNPGNPLSVGTITTGTTPSKVMIIGRYAFVLSGGSGIQIYDMGGAYIQQLQAGGTETGTLNVDSNTTIGGNTSINAALSVTGSTQVGGSFSVAGATSLTGSVSLGGGIIGGFTDTGLSTPSSPTVNTNGTFGAQTWGYEIAAVSASGGQTPLSAQGVDAGNGVSTLTTTNFQDISWTPVTGAVSYKIYRTQVAGTSPNPATTGYIGSTSGTSFSDTGIALQSDPNPANTLDTSGAISVNGYATFKNTINSTTAFQIMNAAGTIVLVNVDTSGDILTLGGPSGQVIIGTATNGASFASGSGQVTYNGTARHTKSIILTPEYAGATLSNAIWGPDGTTGVMTSGYTGAAQYENYYQWANTQATNQAYDIVVSIPVPADFSAWASATPISVDINTNSTANGTVTGEIFDTSHTQETNWNQCALTPGATGWATSTGCSISGTYTAGSTMTLIIQVEAAPTTGVTQLGNIKLSYLSAF